MELIRAAQMTRPADTTAYASGDLIANSTTAGSVVPITFSAGFTPYRIQRITLFSSNNTVTNKNFILYLFSALPTVSAGDNGAFAVATNAASVLGVFGSSAALATGGGCVNTFYPMDSAAGFVNGWLPMYVPGTFYGLLRANAAYTPTSAETFDFAAEGFLDLQGGG